MKHRGTLSISSAFSSQLACYFHFGEIPEKKRPSFAYFSVEMTISCPELATYPKESSSVECYKNVPKPTSPTYSQINSPFSMNFTA
jgi:hypothetical protein